MGKKVDGIQWVVDATNKYNPSGSRKCSRVIRSVSEKWGLHVFRVSICSQCDKVWDWLVAGDYLDIASYKDFPKFNLPSQVCYLCDDTHKPTKKPIGIINDTNAND